MLRRSQSLLVEPSAIQQSPAFFIVEDAINIWNGEIHWSEKQNGIPVRRQAHGDITYHVLKGTPPLSGEGWPDQLLMQMVPKSLINQLGQEGCFLNAKTVKVTLEDSAVAANLRRMMESGYVGCVHVDSEMKKFFCPVKVFILHYSRANGTAYFGVVPVDQIAFVNRLRQIIHQQKEKAILKERDRVAQVRPQEPPVPPHRPRSQETEIQSPGSVNIPIPSVRSLNTQIQSARSITTAPIQSPRVPDKAVTPPQQQEKPLPPQPRERQIHSPQLQLQIVQDKSNEIDWRNMSPLSVSSSVSQHSFQCDSPKSPFPELQSPVQNPPPISQRNESITQSSEKDKNEMTSLPMQMFDGAIWNGTLQWLEKVPGSLRVENILRHTPCQVTTQIIDGQPKVSAHDWPQRLVMQLIPKDILIEICEKSTNEMKACGFELMHCEAVTSLTLLMKAGFAGCVHFCSPGPDCKIKLLILLYSKELVCFLGFVPSDQVDLVARIREAIQKRKDEISNRQAQQHKKNQADAAAAVKNSKEIEVIDLVDDDKSEQLVEAAVERELEQIGAKSNPQVGSVHHCQAFRLL